MYYSNVLTVTVSSWKIARWKPFGILLNGMTTHTFGITERDDNPYHLVLLNGITTLTFGTIKWDDNPYLWNYWMGWQPLPLVVLLNGMTTLTVPGNRFILGIWIQLWHLCWRVLWWIVLLGTFKSIQLVNQEFDWGILICNMNRVTSLDQALVAMGLKKQNSCPQTY